MNESVKTFALADGPGAHLIRSVSATVYYVDVRPDGISWVLRVPGRGSSTGPFDGVWALLVSVSDKEGSGRVRVGFRHRYLMDHEPGQLGMELWWLQREVTQIERLALSELPPGRPPSESEWSTGFRYPAREEHERRDGEQAH